MDITPRIPQLAASREQVLNLMGASSTVACFGSRALLSLFVCAAPEPASVVGAVTTEAEALELIARHQPGFLFVTEHLEAGSGLGLVKQAHRLCPDLRTLLILQSASAQLLQDALEAGCNGVVVESHLAQGAMVDAIRAVVGGVTRHQSRRRARAPHFSKMEHGSQTASAIQRLAILSTTC